MEEPSNKSNDVEGARLDPWADIGDVCRFYEEPPDCSGDKWPFPEEPPWDVTTLADGPFEEMNQDAFDELDTLSALSIEELVSQKEALESEAGITWNHYRKLRRSLSALDEEILSRLEAMGVKRIQLRNGVELIARSRTFRLYNVNMMLTLESQVPEELWHRVHSVETVHKFRWPAAKKLLKLSEGARRIIRAAVAERVEGKVEIRKQQEQESHK